MNIATHKRIVNSFNEHFKGKLAYNEYDVLLENVLEEVDQAEKIGVQLAIRNLPTIFAALEEKLHENKA